MLRTVVRMLRLVWSIDLRASEVAACSDRDLPYELPLLLDGVGRSTA
jgi:hypothetical protein